VVVALRGELDLATVEQVRSVLSGRDGRSDTVILDLRGLTFIDSSGLSLCVSEQQRARAGDYRFAVAVGGAPGVRRMFELAGLQETLELIDDPDVALVE
jgi:anti-sigma B factor antagonist